MEKRKAERRRSFDASPTASVTYTCFEMQLHDMQLPVENCSSYILNMAASFFLFLLHMQESTMSDTTSLKALAVVACHPAPHIFFFFIHDTTFKCSCTSLG